jgi:hypothetical protein
MLTNVVARLYLVLVVALVASRPGVAAEDAGDALRRAASTGDLARVKELLAAGVDVNAANSYGGTALAFAADHGQVAVVDLLLERGADVNAVDRYYHATPLVWAASRGHAEIVRALLARGAEGEAEALASAAGEGKSAVVKVILERGKLAPEALSDALLAATQSELPEVVALLVAAGAKPHAVVAVDPAVLASYAGAYEGEDLKLTVAAKEGKLIVTADRWTFAFVAADPTTFRAEEVPGMKVSFQVEAGKVSGVTLHQGSRTTPLTRKVTP